MFDIPSKYQSKIANPENNKKSKISKYNFSKTWREKRQLIVKTYKILYEKNDQFYSWILFDQREMLMQQDFTACVYPCVYVYMNSSMYDMREVWIQSLELTKIDEQRNSI